MKRLLIIGYVWPEPNSSAAGARMMQLIELFLANQWQITYASPAAESDHRADIEALGIKKVSIELNSSSFDDFVIECQPDAVLFDRFMMEEQFSWRVEKHCPNALKILDTEDLHCLRDARHKALKQQRQVTDTDLSSGIAIREVASILRSDLSLMISDVEMELLQNHYQVPNHILHHCRFMLPSIPSDVELPSYAERQHFIAIGNFRHQPNWDAVLYLKQTIWPLIRKKISGAELHIYGAYPPPKATQLHNEREGFHIMGWAENAETVMSSAKVCLAPLRFGAGIKGKLTQAMQCGTPSVTTMIGAEAMHDGLAWSGFIEDDPVRFAEQAVALYQDKILWLEKQNNGFEIINQCYNGEQIGVDLMERVEQISAQLEQHRLANFIGTMLRHHTMKSCQYMSQWIEAKNKNN